jgi:hypothetical protein
VDGKPKLSANAIEIQKILVKLEKKDGRFSNDSGAREETDCAHVFRPAYKAIAELYGLGFFSPTTGKMLIAPLGNVTRRGTSNGTVGLNDGLDNSLMEVEFKSAM